MYSINEFSGWFGLCYKINAFICVCLLLLKFATIFSSLSQIIFSELSAKEKPKNRHLCTVHIRTQFGRCISVLHCLACSVHTRFDYMPCIFMYFVCEYFMLVAFCMRMKMQWGTKQFANLHNRFVFRTNFTFRILGIFCVKEHIFMIWIIIQAYVSMDFNMFQVHLQVFHFSLSRSLCVDFTVYAQCMCILELKHSMLWLVVS